MMATIVKLENTEQGDYFTSFQRGKEKEAGGKSLKTTATTKAMLFCAVSIIFSMLLMEQPSKFQG